MDPIIEFVLRVVGPMAGHVIKEGARYVWQNQKSLSIGTSRRNRTQLPFVTRTAWVNCRMSEMRSLESALLATPQSRVVFFTGDGGIGKTRLLEEARRMVKDKPIDKKLRWGGLLDLYHSEFHDVSHLQRSIIERLDPRQIYFSSALKALDDFEQSQLEGLTGMALRKERDTVASAFLQDYQAFSKKFRPVLAFDTAETLQHESELIQSICNLEDLGGRQPSILQWLLEQAPQLDNTVILLAGRPQPQMQQLFRSRFHTDVEQFQLLELKKLTNEELKDFMILLSRQIPQLKKLPQEIQSELLRFSNGYPVRLMLGLELLLQNIFGELPLPDGSPSEEWSEQLINSFFAYIDRPHFYYLTTARKGLNTDLLTCLEPDWSLEECEQRFQSLRNSSLVKQRTQEVTIFWHDELYALFDQYYSGSTPSFSTYTQLVEYYRFQHTQANEPTQVNEAKINELYYALCLDPQNAFQDKYLQWTEDAIKTHNKELDMRLRDELLRFLTSAINQNHEETRRLASTIVERDSVILWIKRFLIDGDHERAVKIAETILSLGPEPFKDLAMVRKPTDIPNNLLVDAHPLFHITDPFFWGHLLTYYAESLAYMGIGEEEVKKRLDLALTLLQETTIVAETSSWLRNRVIGRAYNMLGYINRMTGHTEQARIFYEKALPYLILAKARDEEADTRNNLSFVLGILGEFDYALTEVEAALEIRLLSKQRFPIALSYNTRGLLLAEMGHLERAQRDCQRALQIFQEVESSDTPRGTGLASDSLGHIFRLQGKKWQEGEIVLQEAEFFFRRSEELLIQAEEIFSQKVKEPLREWDAYDKRGHLYYDWGVCLTHFGKSDGRKYLEKSLFYYNKALELARQSRQLFQTADAMNDIKIVQESMSQS